MQSLTEAKPRGAVYPVQPFVGDCDLSRLVILPSAGTCVRRHECRRRAGWDRSRGRRWSVGVVAKVEAGNSQKPAKAEGGAPAATAGKSGAWFLGRERKRNPIKRPS